MPWLGPPRVSECERPPSMAGFAPPGPIEAGWRSEARETRPSPTRPRSRGARDKVVRRPKGGRGVEGDGSTRGPNGRRRRAAPPPPRTLQSDARRIDGDPGGGPGSGDTRGRVGDRRFGFHLLREPGRVHFTRLHWERAPSRAPLPAGALLSRRLGQRRFGPVRAVSAARHPSQSGPSIRLASHLGTRYSVSIHAPVGGETTRAVLSPPWVGPGSIFWISAGVPCIGNHASRGPKEKWKISW